MCVNKQQRCPSVFLSRSNDPVNDGDGLADVAGGMGAQASASEMYSKTCKETGGYVPAGSDAAKMMRAAMTLHVRQSSRNDHGHTPKGGETAKMASREAARKRPLSIIGGSL